MTFSKPLGSSAKIVEMSIRDSHEPLHFNVAAQDLTMQFGQKKKVTCSQLGKSSDTRTENENLNR
jgi:hypothetical protein